MSNCVNTLRARCLRRFHAIRAPAYYSLHYLPAHDSQTPRGSIVHNINQRSFTTSTQFRKKSTKTAPKEAKSANVQSAEATGLPDPYDLGDLEVGIQKAHETLKDALSKLRAGGRFNPELVENIRVQIPQSTAKGTERLADLAQVVPRGRTLQIIAGDKEHMRNIISAVQTSKLNLNPQQDAQNPAQLNINLPPPTAESRKDAVNAAIKAAQNATTAVQNSRSAQQKRLRSMQVSKSARPDDLKKAGAQMEKVVEKGINEIKKIVDSARKVLES